MQAELSLFDLESAPSPVAAAPAPGRPLPPLCRCGGGGGSSAFTNLAVAEGGQWWVHVVCGLPAEGFFLAMRPEYAPGSAR